ncbi:MAG TPA: hypothetical protein VFW19_01045 [Allosphingosinicella sp.]|nr:hypothetical protein [Allosphingosinicella sp.]
MNRLITAAAIPALLLGLAACKVTVDNQTQAQIDNAQDQIDNASHRAGAEIDNAASAAGNTADRIGNEVEQGADKIGNGVDVHVNLHGDRSDNSSSEDRD